MKTAFLLGGFDLHSTAKDGLYPVIEQGLRAHGYNVVPTDISWRRKVHTQYVKEFIELYNSQKTEHNIIIGNSFGAVVAFLATPQIDVDEIYLCSLSPFFNEDRQRLPDAYGIKYFGKRRLNDLRSYSADEVAASINGTKVHVLYGEKEHQTSPPLVARCQEVAKLVLGADIHEIAGAPHNLTNPIYSQAVVSAVISA